MDSAGKPTVISLFAGCGGSSLGYQQAGFHELLAVEWDNNAVETFRLNFPSVQVFHGDIGKLSVEECFMLTGLKAGKLSVLDGSPPCQGFSTAGKRRLGDDRNQLFKEYVRLLNGLQPKCFVMENVTGLVKGHMKQIYLEMVAELRSCGYQVKGQVMNAMYFGVPQSRERTIIIGVRNDLNKQPTHPKPKTKPRTVRDACFDLRNTTQDIPFNPETRTAKIMRLLPAGNTDPKHHSHVKVSWDKPCPTLLKDFLGYFHFWHPEQHRPLTLMEWKRLGGFPDSFQFTDKKEGCQRIGNSVPPPLIKAISTHIRTEFLQERT